MPVFNCIDVWFLYVVWDFRPLMQFVFNLMIEPRIMVCSSFLISVHMIIVSNALLISSDTVYVCAGGQFGVTPLCYSVI